MIAHFLFYGGIMQELLEKILAKIKKSPHELQAYEDLYYMCLETKKTDIPMGVSYLKKLSECIEAAIPEMSDEKKMLSLFSLHKKVLLAAAYYDFESYLLYVEWEREPAKKFYVPRRKVLKPIVQDMQDLEDDKLDLLTISMPPGTGKSTLGIFYLSWIMGKYPDGQNLASAHSGMLTRSFYDGVMQIITDSEYLWSDVFPGVTMASTNSKEETIDLKKRHRFSTLTCRAINASLTGATRCDKILYADDLCSGIEEAMSKERLDKLWFTYTNDLKSRKKMGAKEIHIATRWSVHDVIGRLEQEYGDNPRAKFEVLPALNNDGESNFNYDYGVGFSKEYFTDMQNNLDDASFKALYMNQPIEREGLLYNIDELQRYFELPDEEPDSIIAVCDTKDRGSDYCSMPIAYQYGQRFFIEDFICDNGNPDVVEARLVNMLLKHHVHSARFESNSAGGRIAEKVQAEVKRRGGITKITTKFSTANKETRIIVASGYAKEHFLFKDDTYCQNHREYKTAMNFLCNYTMTGKNAHDDVPDSIAMLVDYIDSRSLGKVEVFKRPW
jgi:predicted phage terminase large subunit-like protein